MIGMASAVRVMAYCHPVDLRKGFEALSRLVRVEMGEDMLSGTMFLFTNRRRDRAKVLCFDGTGLCLFCKRLERGRFAPLWKRSESTSLSLTRTELDLFLQGSKLIGKIALSPPPISKKELAVGATLCA
jgi:transposase